MKEKKINFHLSIAILTFLVISFLFVNLEKVWADSLLTNIEVEDIPRAIEYNPSNENIYVANIGSDSVSVIDSTTNTVIETIEVEIDPIQLEFNPSNNYMYVVNSVSDSVSVIDSTTNTVIETIEVGEGPFAIEYNPSNENIYVANLISNSVSVIDSTTNTVIETIEVGTYPFILEYNPSNENIYVANMDSDSVSVIDSTTNTVIETISTNDGPRELEYNPSNENIYVTLPNSNSVSVIDSTTNTVIETIFIQAPPIIMEYNPSNENIYVTLPNSNSVSVIDSTTNTVIETIEVGEGPFAIEYNPSNENIYTVNVDSNDSSKIDSSTNTVIETIDVGKRPIEIEYNPSNNYMYVVNYFTDDISVISTAPEVIDKPIADAGPEQTVQSGDLVQLDGSNSSDHNNSPLSYSWTQTTGPIVELSNPSSQNPTFTAPDTDDPANLVFELIVTNEDGVESEPDSVTITVNPIIHPIADAGANQTVDSGDIVQLDGTTSSANGGSPIIIYQWTQTQGPTVTLDDSTSAKPSFIAPETLVEENIVFELVVTNEDGVESEPDSVTIFVEPVLLPIADAGPDQEVDSNQLVQLDGSNSSDPNGSSLTYFWNQILGPEVSLSEQSSSNPSFTAPEVNEQTDLTFQLTVTNEQGLTSEPDEVTITVNPISTPPPEPPRTIGDLIRGIIQNPLNVTNSIDTANEIRDILTDNNPDNDQVVCDLIDSENKHTSDIRDILNC